MAENIEAARKAAEEGADGVHDYFHGANLRFFRDRGLLNGLFVPLNFGTNGFQFFSAERIRRLANRRDPA